MSQLVKRNRSPFPSIFSNFFDSGRLLPSVFDLDTDLFDSNGGSLVVPNANIAENEKDYKIEVAAPGLEKKDFKVQVENGILTISAEKEEEEKEERKNYKRREFSYRSFSRSFTLPENSLPDKIDAKYDNGILTLSLPKKEISVSKPVKEIKVS
jgi:HSP20 family protein